MSKLLMDMLNESPGYIDKYSLNKKDLQFFRLNIHQQWLDNINSHDPIIADFISKNKLYIKSYHQVSSKLNHSEIWPKTSRVLPSDFVKQFQSTDLFDQLNKIFKSFEISDEEKFGIREYLLGA